MVNIFAPGDNAYETPLDVRLHRRLGDIYLFSKQSQAALKQYDLALRLSPRDIFLLHKKGLAFLEVGNESGAQDMLDRLSRIYPEAAKWSTEIAGMKGRLFWHKYQRNGAISDLRAARDAYAEGLESNRDSHYMADNVGQLSLLLGENDKAREAFQNGLQALQKTGDRGYWAISAKASCHLGLNERNEGLTPLRQILSLNPEPAALDSVWRGLVRLHRGLGASDEELNLWAESLPGDEVQL